MQWHWVCIQATSSCCNTITEKSPLYDYRHKSLACPLISSITCNVCYWANDHYGEKKLLIVYMDDTMCAIHACITVRFYSSIRLYPWTLTCMQCEVGAMNACSSSYMNQAVNMANIIVWIYLPYELNDILKQFLVDQHHHSLHHKLMILSLMIYFDQWNFHRTVQFMHAFLACMWTCNVCPALYHEVEQHMDVKLNKDEQLLL